MKKKTQKLKKYLLFSTPLILLILYFIYPIPVATIKSVSQAVNEKNKVDEIIVEYEQQEAKYKGFSPQDVKKQWEEKCIEDCLKKNPSRPTGSSLEETCQLRCYSYLITGGGEIYFKISATEIEELKNKSYSGLFFGNFNKNITLLYRNLIKNFHFQTIIIVLLGLILYYGVVFGVSVMKKLEKRT